MNYHEQSGATGTSVCLFVPAAFLLLMLFQSLAEGIENSSTIPTGYPKIHVSYDVRADATYTETDDVEIKVLTEQGVQLSKQMPLSVISPSMMNRSMNVRKMDLVILSAYTRKANGEHINATQLNPQADVGAVASGVLAPPGPPKIEMTKIAFQKAEIGDTLVVSIKTIQNEPNLPKSFTITQMFPKYVAFDDVVISLSAPASLSLHIETQNMEKEEKTSSGATVKWVWKFKNPNPVKFQPNLPPPSDSMPQIRISTYQNMRAEYEANNKVGMLSVLQIPVKELCAARPGAASDGPASGDQIAASINFYFWNLEDMLDRSVSAWNTPTCVFDDGRPKLGELNWGYKSAFSNQPDWSKSLARIEDLKKKFPGKHFVALAEAQYWIDYAWNARGDGYASSVTPEGWKLFHERLEKAEKILNETKSYSAEIPTWYVEMIDVQSALGRSEEDRDKTFLEGTKRYKTFYPTYFTMLHYLSPKWGGSWETVDNLIKWSVDNTKEIDGNSMYARLYWAASGELREGESLFKNTRVSWPKMRNGFEDLMVRHPKSNWNLNNFAKFACEAGDRKTFLSLRRQIGKKVMAAAWRGSPNLELCEAKFSYAE